MPSVFLVQTLAGSSLDSTRKILDPYVRFHQQHKYPWKTTSEALQKLSDICSQAL